MVDVVRWRILPVALAGWVNRHQLDVIECLREENRVLKAQLGSRRARLTDPQRRRLASRGHALGRAVLAQVATLVTPDTILRWHRQLIVRKWTTARRGVRRPGVLTEIRQLTVRMARENPTWGYRRIQGALKSLFVIELASRRVHLVGSTPHPDDAFMVQIARTLTHADDGALLNYRT